MRAGQDGTAACWLAMRAGRIGTAAGFAPGAAPAAPAEVLSERPRFELATIVERRGRSPWRFGRKAGGLASKRGG